MLMIGLGWIGFGLGCASMMSLLSFWIFFYFWLLRMTLPIQVSPGASGGTKCQKHTHGMRKNDADNGTHAHE
jgi:hypothetical protein